MAKQPVKRTAKPSAKAVAMAFDLDGTLHAGDLMEDGLVHVLRHDWRGFLVCLWEFVVNGKAGLKEELDARVHGWTPKLKWIDGTMAKLKAAKVEGRPVAVVTGAPQKLAERALAGVVKAEDVYGTQDGVNMIREAKVELLTKLYGAQGFDYAGDTFKDVPAMMAARHAVVVGERDGAVFQYVNQMKNAANVELVEHSTGGWHAWMKLLRPHQWLKNLLVFVPLITAHAWADGNVWAMTALMFVLMSLAASGGYVLNDMLDVQEDRIHASKHRRPLARGAIPLREAAVVAPLLMGGAVLGGFMLAPSLGVLVAVYLAMTLTYSWWLKHKPVVDVVLLAMLYGLRVVAGAAAGGIVLSFWLVLLALFGFFSLAVLKRYIELRSLPAGRDHARGYAREDAGLLGGMGVASGFLAVIVVALYLNSPESRMLYDYPEVLMALCPLMMAWVGRIWLLGHRGAVDDDPVVFAARDRWSWVTAALALAIVLLAS